MEVKISNIENLQSLLHKVLVNVFSNSVRKQDIKRYSDRFNFACPICRDSNDDKKKRGNLYYNTNTYKCYNCGFYGSLKYFLKQLKYFGYLEDDIPEEFQLDSSYDGFSNNLSIIDNYSFVSMDLEESIRKYGIDRERFKNLASCVEIENSKMEKYLRDRSVYTFKNFLYMQNTDQLVVLNRDNISENIISFQIRNFKKDLPKYLSYRLSTMYNFFKMKIPTEDEFEKLNKISRYFNLLNVSFNHPITYFEGPIDCYFYTNSISLNSVHSNPPFEFENARYFFDFDNSGREVMREYLKAGKYVFLWRKFLDDIGLKQYNENLGKIDFNDIINLSRIKNVKFNYDKYFSNDPLNLIYL